MKRFFCTICKRVKHVRVLPNDVRNLESGVVEDRQGTCRFHGTGRVKPVKPVTKVLRVTTPTPASTSAAKRGR